MEPAVLLIATLVISVLIYCVASNYSNDLADNIEKEIAVLEAKLDNLMDDPDYDLPTYEGIEVRDKCAIIKRKIDILNDML